MHGHDHSSKHKSSSGAIEVRTIEVKNYDIRDDLGDCTKN